MLRTSSGRATGQDRRPWPSGELMRSRRRSANVTAEVGGSTLRLCPASWRHFGNSKPEVDAALQAHRAEFAHMIALAFVEVAAHERAARNGNVDATGPRLCTICRVRLAATARRECHSCRGKARRERERSFGARTPRSSPATVTAKEASEHGSSQSVSASIPAKRFARIVSV
jgi:hypothetical protein